MASKSTISSQLEGGRPYPLGAHGDGGGVNFALFSAHAEKVDLCIFDSDGQQEVARLEMPACSDHVWHGYLPGAQPDLLYGYRVHGPYAPAQGHRFNAHKLLVDPYARALFGRFVWNETQLGFEPTNPAKDLSFDRRDNARFVPKSVVTRSLASGERPPRPLRDPSDSVVYEAHVRGLTRLHPDVPEALRGTFLGLASPAMLAHYKTLGVTAVELLPVQAMVSERALERRGLTNYWGYNPIALFALNPRYWIADPLEDFRTMVDRLHGAGIEVILDLVFNHTAEGSEAGPTLSLRGIDNASYYRLDVADSRHYEDFSGCGNTLNLEHPRVLQMVMDCLRWYAGDLGVDGFRLDLTSALARRSSGFDPVHGFLAAVAQDPVLSQVKMIAEPWDATFSGYALGGFPSGWMEWNDRYRDTVRRFWRGDKGQVGELASRLAGSQDIFGPGGRPPVASINYVTAHDGFTLRDLVSYGVKRNDANGENNRDGSSENWSDNCGTEGPSEMPEIRERRLRRRRSLLATLMLSQGIPMLLAGDEIGRSQNGNNNAYCQDNEISWLNWRDADRIFLDFMHRLSHLRRMLPHLRRSRYFTGKPLYVGGPRDIVWLKPDGGEMTPSDWQMPFARALGLCIARPEAPEDRVIMILNASAQDLLWRLPALAESARWVRLMDTSIAACFAEAVFPAGDSFLLAAGAVALLRAEGKGSKSP